jgi:hypothetical protein
MEQRLSKEKKGAGKNRTGSTELEVSSTMEWTNLEGQLAVGRHLQEHREP